MLKLKKKHLGGHLVCASQTSIPTPVIWGACKTADFKSGSVGAVLSLFIPNKLAAESHVASLRTRLRVARKFFPCRYHR